MVTWLLKRLLSVWEMAVMFITTIGVWGWLLSLKDALCSDKVFWQVLIFAVIPLGIFAFWYRDNRLWGKCLECGHYLKEIWLPETPFTTECPYCKDRHTDDGIWLGNGVILKRRDGRGQ